MIRQQIEAGISPKEAINTLVERIELERIDQQWGYFQTKGPLLENEDIRNAFRAIILDIG